jgi:hypothetical protein
MIINVASLNHENIGFVNQNNRPPYSREVEDSSHDSFGIVEIG